MGDIGCPWFNQGTKDLEIDLLGVLQPQTLIQFNYQLNKEPLMAIADPQTVTVSPASAVSLPRTSSGTNSGAFTSSDGYLGYTFSHQYGKRTRRLARFNHKKIISDPLVTATNTIRSMSISLVVDVPVDGYTAAEAKAVVDGFITQLNASGGAVLTKFLGGEN